MKTGWEVITENNETYTVYTSSILKCIKQLMSDGFKETDIKSVKKQGGIKVNELRKFN